MNKVNESRIQKEYVTYNVRTLKSKTKLPINVTSAFSGLTIEERNEYIRRLRSAGWTLQSIAEVVGVTREMIRIISNESPDDMFDYSKVNSLPVPELPVLVKTKAIRKMLDPEVAQKLKELQPIANQVRGKWETHRDVAEEFMSLINEQTLNGISTYTIAKELGVTVAAINSRLVRYGYKKTGGNSKVFNPIKNR